MRQNYTQPAQLLAISALWFGMNFFWSVALPIWVPGRVTDFVGDLSKGTFLFYITASGAFLSTVVQLIAGPISDRSTHRWGRRRPFILWGTLLTVPGFLIFAGAPSFLVLLLGFLWIQVFLNVATGPYQAVMPDLVPPQKHGLASAYMGVALLLGQGIALVSTGVLFGETSLVLGNWPQQIRLWLLAGITLVVLLATMAWTLLGTHETPNTERAVRRLQWRDVLDLNLRGEANFAWLIASRFFLNLGFYTATFFFTFYLADAIGLGQKAEGVAGILFVVVTFAGLLGNVPAGRLSDKLPKKKVLYATCALLAVAAVLFLASNSLVWVCASAILFGIGWGAFAAVDWALAANLVPMQQAGRYMAIWHLAFTLPQVFAPSLGPVADRINAAYGNGLGWRFAFAFILVYLAAGVFCLRFIREKPVGVVESPASAMEPPMNTDGHG